MPESVYFRRSPFKAAYTEAVHHDAATDNTMQENSPVLPATGFLRLPEVLHFYPVSKSTWWAGIRAGRYPRPVKLGERCTAWRAEDIRALIEAAGSARAAA